MIKLSSFTTVPSLLALAVSIASFPSQAGEGPHWGYTGQIGPDYWGNLADEFVTCSKGKNQSPIDIQTKDVVTAELQPLELHYDVNSTEVVNNGHTLQMNVEPGAYMMAEGVRFELLQFHLHSPSEHLVDGKAYPLEIHFVHRSKAGEIAVVGVLFEEGDHHPSVTHIEDIAPKIGESIPFKAPLTQLVAEKELTSYYRYGGSLTTPPCTEGLRWYIWPSVMTVSSEQIDTYVEMIGFDARDAQPMNARFVLFSE